MKIFFIYQLRNILTVAVVGAVVFAGYITDPNFFETPKAEAVSVSGPVSGWAWSETIGWVSFSCTNDSSCGTSNYGVSVSAATGDFSGYAWSENIGWINLAPLSGYPSVPNHGARLEADDTVTGWARACAGTVNGDCTGASRTDGWNGWVKLSKDTSDSGASYGVTVAPATGVFSSYAWGSDVVGWIDFAPISAGANGVHLPIPTVTVLIVPAATTIQTGTGTTLSWTTTPPTACIASGSWSGAKASSGTNVPTGNLSLAGTYSYRLDCGVGFDSKNVVVEDPAPVCVINSVCDAGETVLNCPTDCRAKVKQF